jgi:hypothetical protein
MAGILSAADNSSEESGEVYSPSSANNYEAVSKFGYFCPSLLKI